ncbi:MAG: HEAT repeat domain-containing protein [Nitrospirae bacterium]|nr:HEAT repeat domain-containing protein [Nitrospirota bacterium]
MVSDELRVMVLDHMEKGYLENIIDMLRHDGSLYPLVIDMMRDERMRVRLGATALVEEMVRNDPAPFIRLIPSIAGLLQDANPVVRGDAANLLEIIGHTDALPFLRKALDDKDQHVREIVEEAVRNI